MRTTVTRGDDAVVAMWERGLSLNEVLKLCGRHVKPLDVSDRLSQPCVTT